MSGIVGIEKSNESKFVQEAIERIRHRGSRGPLMIELPGSTQAQIWSAISSASCTSRGVVFDGAVYNWKDLCPVARDVHSAIEHLYTSKGPEFVQDLDGPFAIILATDEGLFVARDAVGVIPLYEGSSNGVRCYASEVKALLGRADGIKEFPPGSYYHPREGIIRYRKIKTKEPLEVTEEEAALKLRQILEESVGKRVSATQDTGAWLSGGLDSSVMAALGSRNVPDFKTFAVGIKGAVDLEYARMVADHINSTHHELIVDVDDILRVLPEVIYHLESFDALLVRSSIMNFMVGKLASDHVPAAFSGEGGDELFAGYEYLKELDVTDLPDELVDITNRLHNTALQRVDRCSSAHELTARTGFLDRHVLDLALRIPPEYKMLQSDEPVEKWILRKAAEDLLPYQALYRKKSKFWEGSGISDMLEHHANETVTDSDFNSERQLPDGSTARTKEELFYYRIFEDCFGELEDLSFVGRTKGAPEEPVTSAKR